MSDGEVNKYYSKYNLRKKQVFNERVPKSRQYLFFKLKKYECECIANPLFKHGHVAIFSLKQVD